MCNEQPQMADSPPVTRLEELINDVVDAARDVEHNPYDEDYRARLRAARRALVEYVEQQLIASLDSLDETVAELATSRQNERQRFVQGFVEGAEWCRGRRMFTTRDIRTPAGRYAEERYNALIDSRSTSDTHDT